MYIEWMNRAEFERKFNEDKEKMKSIFLSTVAEEAANKIAERAKTEIARFYGDRPHNVEYERTNNLRDNSYQKVLTPMGDYYEAGVHISADMMNDYVDDRWIDHHRVRTAIPGAKEAVAFEAWTYGIHGPHWNVVQVTSPSPWYSLYNYAYSASFTSYLKQYGMQQVAKGKYNFDYSF